MLLVYQVLQPNLATGKCTVTAGANTAVTGK